MLPRVGAVGRMLGWVMMMMEGMGGLGSVLEEEEESHLINLKRSI